MCSGTHTEKSEKIRRNRSAAPGRLIFVKRRAAYGKETVARDISRVFGVASVSHAVETESDLDAIYSTAAEYMNELIRRDRSGLSRWKRKSR